MNITANETTRKRFSVFAILLIALSTIFQPLANIAFAADSSISGDKESCDCIHMEKDVEGKTTYEVDREKEFEFNLKFLIPEEVAEQSNEIVVSDVLDERLKVHKATVVTKDNTTVKELQPKIEGQKISLVLTSETKDKWNNKELHIKVVASINKEVADNEVIPNTFTINLDGKVYTSNGVTVKANSVPLTPIEPIETEMPKIKKDVEGKTSHEAWKNDKFTFNIKTTIPNNLNTYKGLTIVDDLDDKFQIDSTKVLVSGKESKFNASVKGQEVSLELTRDELNELKGKEVTIQIQVVQQMVYSDEDRFNKATVIVKTKNGNVEENKEVKSNEVRIKVPRATSIKTVEGNVEIVNDWAKEYKASNFEDEYTFVIKTQLPKLEQLGEGLRYFKFEDQIDQNLEVISAEVFLDDVPYTNLASNFVDSIGVGQSFNLEDYKGMQGKEMTVKITVKAKDGKYPKEVKNQANISFKFEGTEFTGVGNHSNNVTVKYPDVQPKINKTVNGRTTQTLMSEDEEFYFEIKGLVSDKYKLGNKGAVDKLIVVDNLNENFKVLSTELRVGDEVKDAANYITLKGNNLTFNVEGNEINDFLNEEFVIKINAKLKDGYEGTSFSNRANFFLYSKGSLAHLDSNYVYVYPPKKEVPTPEPKPVSVSVQKVWEGEKKNSVTVELFADGKKVNQIVLSDSNNWKHTFSNLDGSKTYTVKEVKVEGYETKITGNAKNGFVITNTEIVKPTPEPEQPKTDLPLVCECEVPTPPTPQPEVCTDFTVTVEGESVENANVIIKDEKGNTFAEGKVDKDGKFVSEKPLIVDEKYTVEVTKEGYKTATKEVTGDSEVCYVNIPFEKEEAPVTPEPEVCTDFTITVKGEDVKEVDVVIQDKEGNVFAEGKTDKDGKFMTDKPLVVDEEYVITVTKEGYEKVTKVVKGQEENCFTEIEMKKVKPVDPKPEEPKMCDDFTVKVIDSETKELIDFSLVDSIHITKVKPNDDGSKVVYGSFGLNEWIIDPLKPDEDYIIDVTVTGYEDVNLEFTADNDTCEIVVEMEVSRGVETPVDPEPKVCTDFIVETEPNAIVMILDKEGNEFAKGKTDEKGLFVTKEPLKIDEVYTVVVEKEGYKKVEKEVVGSTEECATTIEIKKEEVKPEEPKVCKDFTVTVKGNNVENVNIKIKDKDGNTFAEGKTDNSGKFVTDKPLNLDEEYTVTASKSGYKTVNEVVKGQTENCFIEIEMKKRPSGGGGSTPPKVCDGFTVETEPDAKVVIKDEEGNTFAEGETNKDGTFVSTKPLEKDKKYTVEVTKKGYKSVEKVIIGETEDCFTKIPMEKEEELKPVEPTPEPEAEEEPEAEAEEEEEEEPTPEFTPEESQVCEDFTVNTVPGSKVTIIDENGKVFAEGEANKEGKFVIEKPLGEGKYQVIIEAEGYEKETFIIESNEECQVELPLKEEKQEDEEIVVPVDEEEEKKGEKLPQMNQGTNLLVMIVGLLLMVVSVFSIRKIRMNE